jgi:hypothetical protein
MDHMLDILVLLVSLNPKLVNMVHVLLCVHGRSSNCKSGFILDVCVS